MINKDEFETIINNLRSKLDETSVALVSEELLQTLSAFNNGYDEYEKMMEDITKLKNEKEELLKVNGKLYQKIGFDREDSNKKESESDNDNNEELKIEDLINEKGEMM